MDVLVVDGSGFIGANFVRHLLDKYIDCNIVCIEKPETDRRNFENLEENSRFHCYVVDTRDFLKFFKFWFKVDMIVSFSGDIVRVSNLLELLKKHKVKKYVQISAQQQLDSLVMNALPVPVVLLKLSNNYGYFQHPAALIPSLIINALTGEKLSATDCSRDWVNVFDCCRCLETLIHYGQVGEIYTLGGDNKIKDIEIASFILDYLQIPKKMLEFKQEQKDNSVFMGFSKLKKQYEWSPLISMSAGLSDTIEWYKENECWWKDLKIG